jgi:hypothetical protein
MPMGRLTAALLLFTVVISPWWQAVPTGAQSACGFSGRFAALYELVGPDTVGACLEDEHANPDTGDLEQRTTGGVLVWRAVDGVAVFDDGVTSWVNGPAGLQSRSSNERFTWERDSESPSQAPSSADGGGVPSSASNVPSLFVLVPPQPTAVDASREADSVAPPSPTSAPTPAAPAPPGGSAPPTRTPARVSSTPTSASIAGRTSPVGGQCPSSHRIKGATSSTGQKLFYEPERPEYAKVTPDACFTAGGDARDAGYVSSKR